MIIFQNIYDSLAEFIASLDPVKVMDFHAPANIQQRVEALLEKKRNNGLTEDEQDELNHYFILEHIVRLAKTRAKVRLAKSAHE